MKKDLIKIVLTDMLTKIDTKHTDLNNDESIKIVAKKIVVAVHTIVNEVMSYSDEG